KYCVAQGIRQFLDIGSGIPTAGNVHEIAQKDDPDCRVVYVDIEPVAVAHSEMILQDNPNSGVVRADFRDPHSIRSSSVVHKLIDPTQPVALLVAAVLHFIPKAAEPEKALARYVDWISPGS